MRVYVSDMGYLSIRDLQKISSETIKALDGPTAIKSGAETIGILVPLKKPDVAKLEAAMREGRDLTAGRDAAADDAALRQFGEVDPVDWTHEAVESLRKSRR